MKGLDLLVGGVKNGINSVKDYVEYIGAKKIVRDYNRSSKRYTSLGMELMPRSVINSEVDIICYKNRN
ncbi:MAG: hypothetical protein Q7S33_02645 [Nanoarchaeota archaeon]|nr:hypothetical protein [Nanoarchaeota archaeon]